jgi:hypothetical protein
VDMLDNLLSHFEMRGRKSTTIGLVVPKGSPQVSEGHCHNGAAQSSGKKFHLILCNIDGNYHRFEVIYFKTSVSSKRLE